MKTISILSAVFVNLSVGLAMQQIIYGIQNNTWIDFSTWSATTLGFELLFLLSIVFYSIERSNRSLRPMKFNKHWKETDNIYFPKD